MYVAVLDTGATIEAGTAADSEKSPNARVYGAYGSPKGPPSPSAAAVSARRATFNSTQGSGHLAERLARLRAEHTAEEDELVHQLQEARASEEEICRNSEKRLLHAFIPEETIKTPISHTGVAAASSASSIRPQLVQTPRQRVPTEKMERLGIETSSDVLESRQGEEDWVKRKETETERAAEVARKGEEKKRIRELEEEAARITAASEEEVRHSKVEEEELVLEEQKLETLAERTFVADSRVFNVAGARASDFTSSRSPLAVGKMEPKDDISSATSPSVAAVATSAADTRYDSSRDEGFRLFPSGLLDAKLVSATIKEDVGSSLFEFPGEDNSITGSFNAAPGAHPLNYTCHEMQSTLPAAGTVAARSRLSKMLEDFSLEDEVSELATNGIKHERDLVFLDEETIKEMSLTPIAKSKLRQMTKSFMSPRR